MTRRVGVLACCIWLVASVLASKAEEVLVTIDTPRGVKQSFLMIKPERPVAAVVLFAGGHGGLGLRGPGRMTWGERNFLVRTRARFASRGFAVAVVDVPSDRQKINALFRMSRAHASDIGAVAAYLAKQAAVPVWLVGTSMGTFSAAGGAIAAAGVDGLVLTSTVTRSKAEWKMAKSHPNGVASMALERITVPTLILSHLRDGCELTPAADASKLQRRLKASRRVEVVKLEGGRPPQSEPCQAMSEHGFLGIEDTAVATIAAFVTSHSK